MMENNAGLITYAMHLNLYNAHTSYAFVETYSDGTEREILQIHIADDSVSSYVNESDERHPAGTHDEIDFLRRIA